MNISSRQNPLSSLRRILEEKFDVSELRSLCFDLEIEYDDLAGPRKTDKTRDLVAFLNRRNRILDLIRIGKQVRPDIHWDGLAASDGDWTTLHVADLEQSIRESYSLIREYEDTIRLSERPKEKLRARRGIEEQWELIEEHLDEYLAQSCEDVPDDIEQVSRQAQSWKEDLERLGVSALLGSGEGRPLRGLLSSRRFRIAACVTLLGIVVLVGAIWWSVSSEPAALFVEVWPIEGDSKGDLLISKRFSDFYGDVISDSDIKQIGDWVIEQIWQEYGLEAEELQISVVVPANLESDELTVDVKPSGPFQLYYWVLGEEKNRGLLERQFIAKLGQDFYLEISRSGYARTVVEVTWGSELDEELYAERVPIRIAIEEFKGVENSIATQLAGYLADSDDSQLLVTPPDQLEKIRKDIAEQKAFLSENPFAQVGIRSFGVDFIISGRYVDRRAP